jgi:hypothetical protein
MLTHLAGPGVMGSSGCLENENSYTIEKLQATAERYVEELVGINRRVGELEAENRSLRQLPAGKPESTEAPHGFGTPPREPAPDAFTRTRNDEVVFDQPSHSNPL